MVSGRQGHPVRDQHDRGQGPLQPALPCCGHGRLARDAAPALRGVRGGGRGRPPAGLHAANQRLPHLEAVPRRLDARHLALRSRDARREEPHPRPRQRRPADVARRHALLPLRPRREQARQHLGPRHGERRVSAGHPLRGVRRALPVDRALRHRVRERRPPVPARAAGRGAPRGQGRGGDRPGDAAAAGGEGRQADRQPRDLAHRQASPARGAGRRLLAARGARCRPRARARLERGQPLPRVVSGRKDRRLLERPVGRVRALRAAVGRHGQRAQGHEPRRGLPLSDLLVPRFEAGGLRRQPHADPALRRRERAGDADRQGALLLRGQPAVLPRELVGGQPLAVVFPRPRQPADRHLPLRHEDGGAPPGDRRPLRGRGTRLRPRREVPLLPDEPLVQADLQRPRQHLDLRQHDARRGRAAAQGRGLSARAPQRRRGQGRRRTRRKTRRRTPRRARTRRRETARRRPRRTRPSRRSPRSRWRSTSRASRSAWCCCRRCPATTTDWPPSPASSSTGAPRARASRTTRRARSSPGT